MGGIDDDNSGLLSAQELQQAFEKLFVKGVHIFL